MKHKDFNPSMPFLDFMEQYDRVERIYFNKEEAASEKEEEKLKKIYDISKITEYKDMPFQPSYRFLTVAYQIAGNDADKVFQILKKNSQLPEEMSHKEFFEINEEDKRRLINRLNQVKNWLEYYAPDFVKFKVQPNMPEVQLSENQEEFLLKVARILETSDPDPEELHDEMYVLMRKLDMKPQKAFQAVYKILIGKKQGPRAASFILSIDKDFVIKRFRLQE